MRPRTTATIGLAFLACALLLAGASARATEPDGAVVLRFEWVEAAPGGAPPRLGIVLRAATDLRDASLVAQAPPGVRLRTLRAGRVPDDPGADRLEIRVGSLPAGVERRIEYEVLRPEGSGRIAAFTVEARLPDGRPIRESLGVALDRGEQHGRLREGAIEFPAARMGGSTR